MSIVGRFVSIGEAESARSALHAAGIDSMLADEEIIALNWLYSNAMGGVKVIVAEEDCERAMAVLSETAAEPETDDFEDSALEDYEKPDGQEKIEATPCPECGSANIVRIRRVLLFLFFSAVGVGVVCVIGRSEVVPGLIALIAVTTFLASSMRCRACGARWSSLPELDVPPPSVTDTIDPQCPRCGATEVHHMAYRRLKAITLLFELAIVLIVPVWLLLPKWKCDKCGLRLWHRIPIGN